MYQVIKIPDKNGHNLNLNSRQNKAKINHLTISKIPDERDQCKINQNRVCFASELPTCTQHFDYQNMNLFPALEERNCTNLNYFRVST